MRRGRSHKIVTRDAQTTAQSCMDTQHCLSLGRWQQYDIQAELCLSKSVHTVHYYIPYAPARVVSPHIHLSNVCTISKSVTESWAYRCWPAMSTGLTRRLTPECIAVLMVGPWLSMVNITGLNCTRKWRHRNRQNGRSHISSFSCPSYVNDHQLSILYAKFSYPYPKLIYINVLKLP